MGGYFYITPEQVGRHIAAWRQAFGNRLLDVASEGFRDDLARHLAGNLSMALEKTVREAKEEGAAAMFQTLLRAFRGAEDALEWDGDDRLTLFTAKFVGELIDAIRPEQEFWVRQALD